MDISIHALLAESDHAVVAVQLFRRISIHALLAESDWSGNQHPPGTTNFYPRSPCGERRYSLRHSTQGRHFYPRSPCGERHQQKCRNRKADVNFYPRSPCGERPPYVLPVPRPPQIFLSTLSLRRATLASRLADMSAA